MTHELPQGTRGDLRQCRVTELRRVRLARLPRRRLRCHGIGGRDDSQIGHVVAIPWNEETPTGAGPERERVHEHAKEGTARDAGNRKDTATGADAQELAEAEKATIDALGVGGRLNRSAEKLRLQAEGAHVPEIAAGPTGW